MRILLLNHGAAPVWRGGDGVQIQQTARCLRERGHEVQALDADAPDVHGFDLVHIFNCRIASSFDSQVRACSQAGVPIVVSPIWLPISRAIWGSRGSHGVLRMAMERGESAAERTFALLRQRVLKVQWKGELLHADGHGYPDHARFQLIGDRLKMACALLPNSLLELQSIRSDFHWTGTCFRVAHIGVNASRFINADPLVFAEYSGIRHPFVLQAGRIEPGKNQAMLCWALRKSSLPVVFIGGHSTSPEYAQLCREILGDRLTVIDHLPQELLASAYAAAGVHVLPSWMETCGLVSLEASLSETPVVGSTFGHELEYLQGDAWYCDPADPVSIREAVLSAWDSGRGSPRTRALRERVLTNYTWDHTAEQSERLYALAADSGS